ncbi:MAG: 4-hydroxy-3-methylbut-2-enyl diphosphate reductase [Deltaproteobacteria bacterium]|jgi:4-hydroxy-3-methylbut-2-enyl diphosphate reductase|nr:4-hydroxy-3-methylbut-2-enyl diphosphate reductase [Deltaproteobacteria bacterium]
MKIKLAKNMGYCFGVRRAMNLTFSCLEQRRGPVYSHGPLIHNRQALDLLKSKGLRDWAGEGPGGSGLVIGGTSESESGGSPGGGRPNAPRDLADTTVIIRAHGLPPESEERLRGRGARVVDATCPKVAGVQRLVSSQAAEGSEIVIWGSEGHPEVEGLLGYARGRGRVVSSPEDVAALPDMGQVLLVAQTTQDQDGWPEMERAVKRRFPGSSAVNTICRATVNRQAEARRLALESQALVVVGGRDSGNTRRLYEIGKKAGLPTLAVEGPGEIDPAFVAGLSSVGLVAGASTPLWQIRAVHQKLAELARSGGRTPQDFLARFLRALVLSNIYIGLGAGCLAFALADILGYRQPGFYFSLFFFFVQANHLLNAFLDRSSARNNDPDRAAFLAKYRKVLVVCGIFSYLMSLFAAALAGPLVLCLLLFSTLCRVAYNFPLPRIPFAGIPARSLSDLPLAKTLAVGCGWAATLTLSLPLASPPVLAWDVGGLKITMAACGCVFLNLLCRTLLTDFEDSLGDKLFGTRTSVTLLGPQKATKLVSSLLALWALYLIFLKIFVVPASPILLLLIPGPLLNALALRRLVKDSVVMGGYKFDLALDGQFFLTWLLALAWQSARPAA